MHSICFEFVSKETYDHSRSGVSTQNGAHGKVSLCALFNNFNIRYGHHFYER